MMPSLTDCCGGGVLAVSREKELSEACVVGCHVIENIIFVELHRWVSKVLFPLV